MRAGQTANWQHCSTLAVGWTQKVTSLASDASREQLGGMATCAHRIFVVPQGLL